MTVSISISKDLDVRVFHGGLPVSHSFPDHICTRHDVITILQQLENAGIFVGNAGDHSVEGKSVDSFRESCELDRSAACNPETPVTNV